jgi:heme A synthase
VIVGYFTSTEPGILPTSILGVIFLALAVQLVVIAVQERNAEPTPRLLAYAVAGLVGAQTLFSFWRLVTGENAFSAVGLVCGICFFTVARAALQNEPATPEHQGAPAANR